MCYQARFFAPPSLLLLLLLGCQCDRHVAAYEYEGSATQEAGSVSWDQDELTRKRDLRSAAELTNKEAFLASSNLASFLGLSSVDALHMPVPLTFVFVGFSGDGNGKVTIPDKELQAWLWHLDHVLPHTRVELSELTCAEDGYCTGDASLKHEQPPSGPVHSYVHLNLSCEVIAIKRKAVVTAFEHAIHVFSRPVDPNEVHGGRQVDASKMEAFIDSFITSLGLDATYTFLIINPDVVQAEPQYGYHKGITHQEIEFLHHEMGEEALSRLLRAQNPPLEPRISNYLPGMGSGWAGFGRQKDNTKFSMHDRAQHSEDWASVASKYLKDEEMYTKGMLETVDGRQGASAVVQVARIIRNTKGHVSETLKKDLLSYGHSLDLYSKFPTMHPVEDCLVSNWVGTGRWLLLDLTAAASGFEWGPAKGGDGVVHPRSIPLIRDHFGKLDETKKKVREKERPSDPHYQALQQGKNEHISKAVQERYRAHVEERHARKFAASEPGAEAYDYRTDARNWNRAQREHLAKAEIDYLTRFANMHCQQRTRPPKTCIDVRDEIEQQRKLLARLAVDGAADFDPFTQHKWDIFGDVDEIGLQSHEVFDEGLRSQDLFMGELSAVLSRAIQHVVVPPTASWTRDIKKGQKHDTATPYTKNLQFNIYVLSDSTRAKHEDNAATEMEYFDWSDYMAQVSTLKVGTQSIEYKVYESNLDVDHNMATAVAMSQRTHDFYLGWEETENENHARQYLDSRELAHHLRKQPYMKSQRRTADGIDVPVIIIQLDRSRAMLLDKYYNARAMEDMIIIIVNGAWADEVPTGMSCRDALMARPLSPLKEALAVTLTYLGGLLPPHLGYDPLRKQVTHDWLWSVGAHPFSFTSTGLEYTAMQRDALARSYLLDALDSSVDVVNRGIHKLETARATHRMYAHLLKTKAKAQNLLNLYTTIVEEWRKMTTAAASLQFDVGVAGITAVEKHTQEFIQLCDELVAANENLQCVGQSRDKSSPHTFPVLIISAVAAAAAVFYVASAIPIMIARRSLKKLAY